MQKIKENQNNINNWCKLENILFIFSCIIKYSYSDDPSFKNVEILFETIFDIPKEYTQIMRTVTDILDNSCGCLSNNKNLLEKGFKYLMNGLDNELIIKYCSVSAKTLLNDYKEIMSESRQFLMSLYENKIKNNILDNEKYIYILEGLSIAIAYSIRFI